MRGYNHQRKLLKEKYTDAIPIWFSTNKKDGLKTIVSTIQRKPNDKRWGLTVEDRKKEYRLAEEYVKEISYEFTKMLISIEDYCKILLVPSTSGGLELGRKLDAFMSKYNKCYFLNIFNFIHEWIGSTMFFRAEGLHVQTWRNTYLFYKTHKDESKELTRNRMKWYFKDTMLDIKGVNNYKTFHVIESKNLVRKCLDIYKTTVLQKDDKETIRAAVNAYKIKLSQFLKEQGGMLE